MTIIAFHHIKRDAGCRGSGIPGASALGGAYPTVAMR
jgi:hypothetical protein